MENKKYDVHIGNIKLEPIGSKRATLGILIGDKEFWNKGYATESLNLLISYAFSHLNLNEINLGVNKENRAAIAVYKKCGFKIYKEKKDGYKMKIVKNKMVER